MINRSIRKRYLIMSSILVFSLLNACKQANLVSNTNSTNATNNESMEKTSVSQLPTPEKVLAEDSKNDDDLVPMFTFYDGDTYVIDYQRSRFSRLGSFHLNSKYFASARNNGAEILIFDLVSKKTVQTIVLNCNYLSEYFLVGDFVVSYCWSGKICPPGESIQFWHIPSNSLVSTFEVGVDSTCTHYQESVVSLDENMVLLIGRQGSSMFSIDPPKEMQIEETLDLPLAPSPDNRFFVVGDSVLFKWVDDGFELVESVGKIWESSKALSVSSGAQLMAYLGSDRNSLIIKDTKNQDETMSISVSEIMGSEGHINQTALSHDGQYLLVSGDQNDDNQHVLLINLRTTETLFNYSTQWIFMGPRVILLPEAIRDAWEWQDLSTLQ